MNISLPKVTDMVTGDQYDYFDAEMAIKILQHFDHFVATKQLTIKHKKHLIRLLSVSEYDLKIKNGRATEALGSIKQTYKYYKDRKFGRKHPSGPSLQMLKKQIRNTICNGVCYDFDYKNMYPSIYYYMCKKYNIDFPTLFNYVEDRESILKNLVADPLCPCKNRDEAKDGILFCISGGVSKQKNVFMTKLQEQNKVAQEKIFVIYPQFKKIIEEEQGKDVYNVDGKALTLLFTLWEEYFVNMLLMYYVKLGYPRDKITYIFDGVMLLKREVDKLCRAKRCNAKQLLDRFNKKLSKLFPEGRFEVDLKNLGDGSLSWPGTQSPRALTMF